MFGVGRANSAERTSSLGPTCGDHEALRSTVQFGRWAIRPAARTASGLLDISTRPSTQRPAPRLRFVEEARTCCGIGTSDGQPVSGRAAR